MKRLNQFSAANPDITLSLEATEELVDLERGEASLAIRFVTAGTRLPSSELLFREAFFPVCSPAYLEQHPLRRPEDLVGARLIHATWKSATRLSIPSWGDWFDSNVGPGVDASAGMRFGLIGHAIQGAVAGQGSPWAPPRWQATTSPRGGWCCPSGRTIASPRPGNTAWPGAARPHPASACVA